MDESAKEIPVTLHQTARPTCARPALTATLWHDLAAGFRCVIASIGFVVLSFAVASADDPPKVSPEQLDFFERKIRPALIEHCYECHAAEAKIVQGGLRLDHRAGLLRGGDTGPAVIAGDVAQSLLIKALRHDGLEMPPRGKLADSVIADFEAWVAMGAPDPRDEELPSISRGIDIEEGRKFWSFRPIADPALPEAKDRSWPLDPIDHFVLAKQESAGIRPVTDADRYGWLRRVTLDLTGLPPTPSEIDAFVNDPSPEAHVTVVDRLLDSKAFGQRWARHWLDLTGYADMMGTSNNVYAEHAWRYRDYVIDAFNNDKPFDAFVREQVAGDLMPAESTLQRAEQIIATGFLMVGDVEIVEPDKAKLEADHVDTQVNKIGMAFLGMTLGCVRCHDHKFDPIGLDDYYGIAGMLRSSPSTHKIPFGVWSMLNATELPESPEEIEARQRVEAEVADQLTELRCQRYVSELEKRGVASELKVLEEAIKLAAQEKEKQKADASKAVASEEAKEGSKEDPPNQEPKTEPTPDRLAMLEAEKVELAKRQEAITARIRKLDSEIEHADFFASKVPQAFAMRDGERPEDMPVYIRGNPYAPGRVVPRGTLRVASWGTFPAIPAGQSGRLQLADWLADPNNPLTPRVAVNRIWQKLFGEGIVRSVDYFGTRGELPSHPELLDHLATRFVRGGWSQKGLIRAIVLSRTYRIGSTNDPAALAVDPDNRLLWRMHRQRLDAEALRDTLLAVSGELIGDGGGPALVLEKVENCGGLVRVGVNPPSYAHRQSRSGQEFQRSIYLPVMRTNTTSLDRIRTHFDYVNPAQIAGQRPQTVVPTQALFLMNNELFRKRAKALAKRLIDEHDDTGKRIEQLWLFVFNRVVTDPERKVAIAFVDGLMSPASDQVAVGGVPCEGNAKESGQAASGLDVTSAWVELCHSLLASNEFIFRF